jgi:hypothetical protein
MFNVQRSPPNSSIPAFVTPQIPMVQLETVHGLSVLDSEVLEGNGRLGAVPEGYVHDFDREQAERPNRSVPAAPVPLAPALNPNTCSSRRRDRRRLYLEQSD